MKDPNQKKTSGPLSESAKDFIFANAEILTYSEIAEKLNRRPEYIRKVIKNSGKTPKGFTSENINPETLLKKKQIWKTLEKQFDESELKIILEEWKKLILQFNDDVLTSEEGQIIDYLRISILVDRCLTDQYSNKRDVDILQQSIIDEKAGANDTQKILDLSQQLTFRIAAKENISKEYRDFLDKKGKMLSALKGTREMRVKHLEGSKESFSQWVRSIYTDQTLRKKLGIEMEKLRLAMKAEEARLGQYHKYIDNTYDQPILSSETIINDQDETAETVNVPESPPLLIS